VARHNVATSYNDLRVTPPTGNAVPLVYNRYV
jgi:hypothetical protein